MDLLVFVIKMFLSFR